MYEMATLKHAFTAKNIHALMVRIVQGKVRAMVTLPVCVTYIQTYKHTCIHTYGNMYIHIYVRIYVGVLCT